MPKIKEPIRQAPQVQPANGEEVVYPQVEVRICLGDQALTVQAAKELLGWESETGKIKFADSYLFTDELGNKVRCLNNARNRPFDENWARTIAQEILNRRFKLNLETIIVGKYGQVLSGQHRLIGLVLAGQIWAYGENRQHWREKWSEEPTIETLVALGGDESEECTRTLDNVKPRTLSDVLFTSDVFSDHRAKDRKSLTRIVDYAVRFLWQRTGMGDNPYTPRRTHSEALDFIENHQRVLKCVKHVHEENLKGSISRCLGLGYAAGLMYLMAASESDPDQYAETRAENVLDFSRWNEAADFWIEFSKPSFRPLHNVILSLDKDDEDEEEEVGYSIQERVAIVIKAWQCFLAGEQLQDEALQLRYSEDEDGYKTLDEHPTVGGIDHTRQGV